MSFQQSSRCRPEIESGLDHFDPKQQEHQHKSAKERGGSGGRIMSPFSRAEFGLSLGASLSAAVNAPSMHELFTIFLIVAFASKPPFIHSFILFAIVSIL